MRARIAATLEAVGLLSLTAAGFTVTPGLGFLAAGVGLVVFGLAVERG